MGAFIQGVSHVLVENNRFERNGLGESHCTSPAWQGQNYSHCHGIYLSKPGKTGEAVCNRAMVNFVARRNHFIGNSGAGIQIISNRCDNPHAGHTIQNNVFANNATGMYVWNLRNSVISNNTMFQNNWPKPQKNALNLWDINFTKGTVFANNVLYFTSTAGGPIRTLDKGSTLENTYTNNAVFFPANAVMWVTVTGGPNERVNRPVAESVFHTFFKDTNVVLRQIPDVAIDAAGFMALPQETTPGNFRLTAESLLKGKGNPAHCTRSDLGGDPRPQGLPCSIGAYE
jgi:parallel beta-helix repeat protein